MENDCLWEGGQDFLHAPGTVLLYLPDDRGLICGQGCRHFACDQLLVPLFSSWFLMSLSFSFPYGEMVMVVPGSEGGLIFLFNSFFEV